MSEKFVRINKYYYRDDMVGHTVIFQIMGAGL